MKVRLKLEFAQPVLKGLYCFNSMKVRLKRVIIPHCPRWVSRFNSMKVRLKLYGMLINADVSLFQFHEGPIKTFSVYSSIVKGTEFQFHEGPIKTRCVFVILR